MEVGILGDAFIRDNYRLMENKIRKIRVHLKERSYTIWVGRDMWPQLNMALDALHLPPDAVVITNPGIRRLYGRLVRSQLERRGRTARFLEVADSERSKSFQVAMRLLEDLATYDVHKRIFIVALGGGVVGDLAGFVAAVYKRGVPYIQIPTTFLAQIDSAIGGKVAIDLTVGKNMVGAFYQPRLVFCEVTVLHSLPVRQLRNGLAECVKYGCIRDPELFSYIEQNYHSLLAADLTCLKEVVLRCSRIKAEIVERDEKETMGLRSILNFGHTVGHAIEAAGHYTRYHHGEAIALGMRVAAWLSEYRGYLSTMSRARLERLLSAIGLPEKIRHVSLNHILMAMTHDKKFRGRRNRFVLLKDFGSVKIVEGIPVSLIWEGIRAYMSE